MKAAACQVQNLMHLREDSALCCSHTRGSNGKQQMQQQPRSILHSRRRIASLSSSKKTISRTAARRRPSLPSVMARGSLQPFEDAGFNQSGAAGANSKLPSRREMLLEYVRAVQPEFIERFMQRADEHVVDAMRQTVANMLGSLPPQFFEITVTTVGENLAQLMYSVMMTGYMFRNAQTRMELSSSLHLALSATSPVAVRERPLLSDPKVEEQVGKRHVSGHVLRWHEEEGVQEMAAVEYIDLLEEEVRALQRQLRAEAERERNKEGSSNKLLDYLKGLEPANLQELTASAGEDALEAMNAFIQRLMGVNDVAEIKTIASETSAVELGRMLYWLMVVGYNVRTIEVRFDMERALIASSKPPELPPGFKGMLP